MRIKVPLAFLMVLTVLIFPAVKAEKPLRVNARYSKQTAIIDGNLDLNLEYAYTDHYEYANRDGYVRLYIQHDSEKLIIGLDIDDTDVFPSWGDQVFMGFDLTHDQLYLDDVNDFFILWHGHSHGDPAGGTGPWIGTGVGYGNQPIPDVQHAHQVRQGGYSIEFSIPLSRFPEKLVGFHIRHSPDNNQDYVWEYPGINMHGIGDYDSSYYGDLRITEFGKTP